MESDKLKDWEAASLVQGQFANNEGMNLDTQEPLTTLLLGKQKQVDPGTYGQLF